MKTTKNNAKLKIRFPVIKTDKYAFDSSIESVQMSFAVKKIKNSAFCSCSSLKEVVFSEDLEEIGDYAFLNCSSLEKVILPHSAKKLGSAVFKNCSNLKSVILPDGIKKLPANFFENCSSLKKIVLPESLEIIGKECFSGCINLKEIVFSSHLKEIHTKAFKRCPELETVIFPESLEHIGDMAFEFCKNLNTIVFNGKLVHVGAAVFPESNSPIPKITNSMFCSSFIPKADYELCPTVTIPETVKTLALGFENTLSYRRENENKTCYCHILSLEKYKVKIFISERYYSYNNRKDVLMNDGNFDFPKYDEQFDRADKHEKPIIAAFRLTYPTDLNENAYIIYKTHLNETQNDAALFAVEKNEEVVLKYIVDNFSLSTEFCAFLYDKAARNGHGNLQQILSQKKNKTGFEEIDFLYNEILG